VLGVSAVIHEEFHKVIRKIDLEQKPTDWLRWEWNSLSSVFHERPDMLQSIAHRNDARNASGQAGNAVEYEPMKSGALRISALALMAVLSLGPTSLSIGAAPAPAISAQRQASAGFAKDVLPFLSKHCYTCHGNGKKRGDISLDKFRNEQEALKDRKVWENVLHMVQTGQMPPKERPRPSFPEIAAALRSIEAVLARIDGSGPRNAGRVTLHRLNRTEYNNTIRDLIGIDFRPAADFPNDDVGYGFDNIGDVLTVSPLLMERYLAAADDCLERAIDPSRRRIGSAASALSVELVKRAAASARFCTPKDKSLPKATSKRATTGSRLKRSVSNWALNRFAACCGWAGMILRNSS
jgi:hypothetical protein